MNKEKEAFYSRLSKPKRALKDNNHFSYSKDNIVIQNKSNNQIGINAGNRLYQMSRDQGIIKDRLKRENEERLNRNYSFAPRINKLKTDNKTPLLERVIIRIII